MKHLEPGKKISELRDQKAMTQKELADLCNIDIRTIQRIESGEVSPRKYTLKLLANALGCDVSVFNDNIDNNTGFDKALRRSFIAGVIYSINVIPVVVCLITRSFDPLFHFLTVCIYVVSCIFFLHGFYSIGRKNKNQVLSISALLAMIFQPLINILDLIRVYMKNAYSFSVAPTVFTLVCLNALVFGIGLIMEGSYRRGKNNNLYKLAGVIGILQAILFLAPNFNMVAAGLIISIATNIITTYILYTEYRVLENTPAKKSHKAVLA